MEPETSIPNTRITELYPQLRRLAATRMAMERADHTLQPTALVHEAWIRLSAERSRSWCETASNMFAAVAESMRRVLIDRARRQARQKRGKDVTRVPLDEAREVDVTEEDDQMLLIHEALNRLEEEDAVRARVVVLKFFGGLSNREVAEAMGLGERTVERHWAYARAWLYREIRKL